MQFLYESETNLEDVNDENNIDEDHENDNDKTEPMSDDYEQQSTLDNYEDMEESFSDLEAKFSDNEFEPPSPFTGDCNVTDFEEYPLAAVQPEDEIVQVFSKKRISKLNSTLPPNYSYKQTEKRSTVEQNT